MKTDSPDRGSSLPLVEHFYTLQGEGYHTGKPAYFLRIGGCDVGCSWCDTRFAWNPDMHPLVKTSEIIKMVSEFDTDSVVVTGGEPLMWDLTALTAGLREKGYKTFLETSGAYPLTGMWDWICLSPKTNVPPVGDICKKAGELKIIIQTENDFRWAEEYKEKVSPGCILYLQPEWSRFDSVIGMIVDYCLKNIEWSVSLQSHKYMKIP